MVCFGTRPEVIKVASFIEELSKGDFPFKTVFAGQHDELFADVKQLIPPPDFRLDIMEPGQSPSDILERVTSKFVPVLRRERPDLVVVQGDTSTALAIALVSFYEKVMVGHIEAGLRTWNLDSPFPEELNRQVISRVASVHWAPTKKAVQNLEAEGVENIVLTGNTVIDVCRKFKYPIHYGSKILVTLHRRENHGEKMASMFAQIERLAERHNDLVFLFPMHPNPKVQEHRSVLKKVEVIHPLKYDDLLKLLSEVRFVITDSGGLQEECAVFKKKVLVCRDVSERPEGVEVGLSKVVGTSIEENFEWANSNPVWNGRNPYGDGRAAERIVSSIESGWTESRDSSRTFAGNVP